MRAPLRIAVIDLVTKAPTRGLWSRVMNANFAGIMPQVVSAWCERSGHDVRYICYTGLEDLTSELPEDVDLVFLTAFTQSAQLAYSLSNFYRSRGAITALGGPHARCYPQDARRHFDYVVGFCDEQLLNDLLTDCTQHRPRGAYLSARQQPTTFPSVRERWKYIETTLRKAPLFKIVPMLGSLGCPYTCAFCIDAKIPYAPLDVAQIEDDLRFIGQQMKRPRVSWHDPNFGVRFDEVMGAIEAASPPGGIEFIAESSLSILSPPRLAQMRKNGFKVLLPGVESWYELGDKSKTGIKSGEDKVRHVSDHIHQLLEYIPYVQANFVLGLDVDRGPEPFELTKRFIDQTPGVFPGYSLLTAFGQASPANFEYVASGRVLPFPFHFLNNNNAMNVRPKGYSWTEFYDRLIDLTQYTFSWSVMGKRMAAANSSLPRWMNLMRGISSEGFGRLKFYREVRRRLDDDVQLRRYFDQETTELPDFYRDKLRDDLGPLWKWLPEGSIEHDPTLLIQEPIAADTESRVTAERTA